MQFSVFDDTTGKFCNALGWAQYGSGGKEELIQIFCEGKGIVPKGANLAEEGLPPPPAEAQEEEGGDGNHGKPTPAGESDAALADTVPPKEQEK